MILFSVLTWKTRITIFRNEKQKQAIQKACVFFSGYVEFEMSVIHLNENTEQAARDMTMTFKADYKHTFANYQHTGNIGGVQCLKT